MRHIFPIALFFLLFPLYQGCQNTVNTVENENKTMTPEFMVNKRVVTDGILDSRLEVVSVDQQTLPSGFLKVQLTVRSKRVGFWSWLFKGDEPYKIAYRFTWLNNSGMEVDTATNTWIEKDIIPGDTTFISGLAPNENCKDFLLRMRQLD